MSEEELREKKPMGETALIEVLCFLCFPYICSYWDLPPQERIGKCKALEDSLEQIKQAGYVQLDEDQSLPQETWEREGMDAYEISENAYSLAQQDMLKANFRRIKL